MGIEGIEHWALSYSDRDTDVPRHKVWEILLFVPRRRMLLRYLSKLSTGRLILWCYFIWYSVVLVRYFDPTPRVWLTSLGLGGIIGLALYISTAAAGSERVKLGFWPTFRLFLMPFCVSSFAALVKGKGFVLVFSPKLGENLAALGLCGGLALVVNLLRRSSNRPEAQAGQSRH